MNQDILSGLFAGANITINQQNINCQGVTLTVHHGAEKETRNPDTDPRMLTPNAKKVWQKLCALGFIEQQGARYAWAGKKTDLGYMICLAAEKWDIKKGDHIDWTPFRDFFSLSDNDMAQAKNAASDLKNQPHDKLLYDHKYDSFVKMKPLF